MADGQPNVTLNEFGQPQNAVVPGTPELNQQGKETTLDDILAKLNQQQAAIPPAGKPAALPGAVPPGTPPPAPTVPTDKPADINTGNKALDVAVSSFLKSTGGSDADVQRAVAHAIEYGDAKLIDRTFLTERFGVRADEALAIAEAVVEQTGVERERMVQSVYEVAGGEAKWKESLAVYKQHAPAGLQKALQFMFDSGDAASVKEASQLVVDYALGSGVLGKAGSLITPGSGSADASGLSKADFQAALGQLNQSSRNYHADYTRLLELRRIGKAIGK